MSLRAGNVVASSAAVKLSQPLAVSSSSFSVLLTKTRCASPCLTSSALTAVPRLATATPQTTIFTHPIRLSSTMKKRRLKMNKHKLKKRRKARRMNTKASRVV
eukprot:gene5789-4149_t